MGRLLTNSFWDPLFLFRRSSMPLVHIDVTERLEVPLPVQKRISVYLFGDSLRFYSCTVSVQHSRQVTGCVAARRLLEPFKVALELLCCWIMTVL